MRSKLMLVLVLVLAGPAYAQEAPSSSIPRTKFECEIAKDVGLWKDSCDGFPEEAPAEPTRPVDPQPQEPSSETVYEQLSIPDEKPAEPPGNEPTPEVTPPSSPEEPSAAKVDDQGLVLGFELGAIRPGAGNGVWGVGFGRAVVIGYRMKGFTAEVRLFERYELTETIKDTANTAGAISVTSVAFRKMVVVGGIGLQVIGGFAKVTQPVLAFQEDGRLGRFDQTGLGALVGAGLMAPIGGAFVTVDARAYLLAWEVPGIAPLRLESDGNGGVSYMEADEDGGLPISLTAGVRIAF